MYARRFHRRQGGDFLPSIFRDDWAHAATGRRQSHFNFHGVTTGRRGGQGEVIDQAQVDNINGDFRIKAAAQSFPNGRFAKIARDLSSRWLGGEG